jgi:hypothetical protein
MIRIVLDTNVIVSALVFGGVPRNVLELAEAGQCELLYSEAIQSEVSRVLSEKFGWTAAMLQEVLPVLWRAGELVVPRIVIHAVPERSGRRSHPGMCGGSKCVFHRLRRPALAGVGELQVHIRRHATTVS